MMNILLPTDFSENSRNAAAYALQFFKDTPCDFYLLHVIPRSKEHNKPGLDNMPAETSREFGKLLDWLKSIRANPLHHFHVSFKTDYFIEAVRAKVIEKKIDLILMGTKGATNSQGVIIGKNTSDVMRKVKCPVLGIAADATFKEHKEILFPTDYKIQYGRKMLDSLLKLASLSQTEIRILEIFDTEKEPSLEQINNRSLLWDSFFPKIPVRQTYYRSKQPSPQELFSANKNVDMIVLAAKSINLCQRFLQNGQDENIPFINQLPLLVLHG